MAEAAIQGSERRQHGRVRAKGSVMLQGPAGARGRIEDLSASGLRFALHAGQVRYRRGDRIEIELRLDGPDATWIKIIGKVLRTRDDKVIAVSFEETPASFLAELARLGVETP